MKSNLSRLPGLYQCPVLNNLKQLPLAAAAVESQQVELVMAEPQQRQSPTQMMNCKNALITFAVNRLDFVYISHVTFDASPTSIYF